MISVKMSSVANNSSIQFNAGDIALNDETYLMNKGIWDLYVVVSWTE